MTGRWIPFTTVPAAIKKEDIQNGDIIKVCQLGSKDTVFRSSNEIIYSEPGASTNTQTPASETE